MPGPPCMKSCDHSFVLPDSRRRYHRLFAHNKDLDVVVVPRIPLTCEAAIARTTVANQLFHVASIACAGLQFILYFRSVFILYRPHGFFALETVFLAFPILALQIVGCAFALGASSHKIPLWF
jgi:hypothetical protein